MTTATKKPALPSGIKTGNPQLDQFLQAVAERLNIEDGLRGRETAGIKLDKKPSYRELHQIGLVIPFADGQRLGYVGPPIDGFVRNQNAPGDYSRPPTPENVAATGGFATIFVSWDNPLAGTGVQHFSHAEVWRSATDDLGMATLVGTTIAPFFADSLGSSGGTYYYWVRFVKNVGGTVIEGSYSTSVSATSAQSGDYIIGELRGRISETELLPTLNTRIDGIEVNATAITEARRVADGAATHVTEVTARVAGVEGTIGTLESSIRTVRDAAAGNASNITTVQARVATNEMDIMEVEGTIGTLSSSVQTASTAIAGISAEHFVKLDVNGYVAGYGLYNDGTTSDMVINVDNFAVAKPSGTEGVDGTTQIPFLIGDVDGTSRIVLDAETFIADATITDAKIATLAADKLYAGTGTIADAIIGAADITDAMIGNIIQSTTYDPQSGTGWQIDKGGSIDASAITIRDTSGNIILSSSGTFSDRIDNQNQDWSHITGTGKPDDNATRNRFVTQEHVPHTGTGQTGDLVYVTDNRTLYRRLADGSWEATANNNTSGSQLINDLGWTRNHFTSGTAAPTGGEDGDYHYQSNTRQLYQRAGGTWQVIANDYTSGSQLINDQGWTRNRVTRATTAPANPVPGDFWFNTSTNLLYQRIGTAWNIVGNYITQGSQLSNDRGWTRNNFTTGTNAPTGGANGDFYYRTTTKQLYQRISGTWTVISNAYTNLSEFNNDDGYSKIKTYRQSTPPTGAQTGDIWIRSSDNNAFRRSGSSWVQFAYDMAGIDRITTSNASTFIQDLAVDTLQLADQAVTTPISAVVQPNSSPSTIARDFVSVTANWGTTTADAPDVVQVLGTISFQFNTNNNTECLFYVRVKAVKAGQAPLYSNSVYQNFYFRYGGTMTIVANFPNQSGQVTYSLEVSRTSSPWSGTRLVSNASILVLGVRK